jgi:biopolymer transport protein ExbB
MLGTMYKGGFIVPILMGLLLTTITFAIERFITIMKASGKGNTDKFVAKIKALISNHDFDGAKAECDIQKGSLANVVHEGIVKYQFVQDDSSMDKEEKVAAIQKGLEEATSLELPMLSKNMVVISTMASIGTLAGLIGTVVGMIRAFSALSAAGAPDTSALATGISEALVNTLVGILTSACAIIFYNYFSNRIDQITYAMDEAGYSIVKEFQTSGK